MADTLPPKKATKEKSYLNDDLLIPILARLPAKTLIEFLTACKSWYGLITAPNFISAHHHHHHHKPLLLHFDSEFLCSILPHRRTRLLCPSKCALVGSSNGVVCLFNRDATISLWNPGIGKHLDFDPIPIPYSQDRQLSMGFGFDSSTNDFKAVALSYFSSITLSTSPRPPPQTRVFSLNSGAWSMTEFLSGSWDDLSGISRPIFIDGFIHWIIFHGQMIEYDVREPGAVVYADSILTFDVGSECFGNQRLPFGLGHAMSDKLCVTVVDNFLALVQDELSEYRVWVMIKENGAKASWTQLYRIRAPPHSTWFPWVEEHSKAEVFITTSFGNLVVLDQKTPSSSRISAHFASFWDLFNHTPSLALLDKFSWLQNKNQRPG